tara:strand:+ start:3311 stop:4465 length:1155 start_codon:yes stop_codon:yes gene_type:complete
LKQKKIYYWSPFLTEIATSKAVINSAYSLQKYFTNYETCIVDAIGEFSNKTEEINKKKIKIIKLKKFNLINYLPKYGKFKSRFSFLVIFITSFFGLKNILQKDKPNFLIIHLITLLPLILFFIFNFKTKCILRISGFPIMSPLRKFLWSFLLKKVDIITCPTKNTLHYMKNLKIADESKYKLLYDPIISIREISEKKDQNVSSYNDDFIAVGRLTKQKDFEFLIKNFNEVVKTNNDLTLSIFGEGEEKKKLMSLITKYNLEQNVTLRPFEQNIFPYMLKSKSLVLTSNWEDPGFVLLEAAVCRTFLISSNCKNGPVEILDNNKTGLLFEKNVGNDFVRVFNDFLNMSNEEVMHKKKNAMKKAKLFTIFNHSKDLHFIIDEMNSK